MDLATIEPALCALAATLTGVDAAFCVFENAPRPRDAGQLVLLSWVSSTGVGTDQTRWVYAANADPLLEMTPTVEGPRFAVLQLSILTQDQRAGYTSRQLAERARTRLLWPSSLAALSAVNLALAGSPEVVKADFTRDHHVVSRSILEIKLNASAAEADTAGRNAYIARVQSTVVFSRPDGVALDTDIQPGGISP